MPSLNNSFVNKSSLEDGKDTSDFAFMLEVPEPPNGRETREPLTLSYSDRLGDSTQPSIFKLSLSDRPCCSFGERPDFIFPCLKCGLKEFHRMAMLDPILGGQRNKQAAFSSETDNFDNTALHFAAASDVVSAAKLVELIEKVDINVNAQNTMGETLMHVLHPIKMFSPDQDYVNLLRCLIRKGFHFSARDYRGKCITRPFSGFIVSLVDAFGSITYVLSNLGPDLYMAIDNTGESPMFKALFHRYMHSKYGYSQLNSNCCQFASTLAAITNYRDSDTDFSSHYAWNKNDLSLSNAERLQFWRHYSNWVDRNGDTILTARLKLLERKDAASTYIRSLLASGVEVHAQDCRGNTALGIAAARGLREATQTLLEAGANPNSRNYSHTSILRRATKCMLMASKSNKNDLYASILACQALLVDYGAVQEPGIWLEWSSRSVREKHARLRAENLTDEYTEDEVDRDKDDEHQQSTSGTSDMLDLFFLRYKTMLANVASNLESFAV